MVKPKDYGRSRNRLHKSKLQEFTEFCAQHGWQIRPKKGLYEVLRMVHAQQKDPLLVYTKADAKEHFTTYGHSEYMLVQFLRWQDQQRTQNELGDPASAEAPLVVGGGSGEQPDALGSGQPDADSGASSPPW